MKKFNYENEDYLKSLDKLSEGFYSKYIQYIEEYLQDSESKFLDVGCGNGTVLKQLKDKGYKNGYGAEVSDVFIKAAKSRGIFHIKLYDGTSLPYDDNFFDLVGSFNVLEHTQIPEAFLENQISKLKKGGIIIVACPNFLSVLFPSSHRRLKGFRNKFRNLLYVLGKLTSPSDSFERMQPVIKKKFEYDDDAIVVTNLLDLKSVIRRNKCEVLYESGFINYDSVMYRTVNAIKPLRYFLPSCFIVCKKI